MIDKKIENKQEEIKTEVFWIDKELLNICKTNFPNENIEEASIQILFKNISDKDKKDYWSLAIKNLANDFSWEEFSPYILIFEINALKEYNDKENVTTNKENVTTDKKDVITDKEEKEQLKNEQHIDIQTTFLETKVSYNFLDNKYKSSAQELQQFKDKYFTSEITEKLQTAKINIDDYMAFWYTAEQLIKESGELNEEQITFVNQFNNLNRTLNIDYQINIPTEKMQFADKPKNLSDVIASPTTVLAYPSVREYTNKQPNIINKPTEKIDINPKLQEDIWENIWSEKQEQIRETIKKNCIDNQLLSPIDFTYTATIDIQLLLKSPNTIDDSTKESIQDIIDSVLWSYTQDYLITQTNAQTKQLIITQAIAGLASYFDTDTSAKDNYARDFDLSTWDMTIENNILHISWQMHGQIVHFFYNLQTGELQANDYLYKVMKAESFLINDIDQWRYTLPNALPAISDLQTTMKAVNYADLMKDNTSLSNYQNTIRQKSNSLKEKFSTQTYNKLYITRTNERNLFIQETLDTINTGSGGQSRLLQVAGRRITIDNTPNPVEITRSMHPNEYDLLMILDRTSQVYRSPDQLRTIRNYIHRRNQAIQEPRIIHGTHNDPVINTLFNQQALLEDAENRNNPNKKSNFLLFLDLTINPIHQLWWWTIDITLLEKIINRMENNEPLAILDDPKPASYQNDPRYFNEKYENLLEE